MSSSDEELPIETESESPTTSDWESDAHVGDDVCVAVFSAVPMARKRRRDASWIAAVAVSLLSHMALAAVWWEWRGSVEMPDFAIRAGVGGTVGTGTTDDESATPPAMAHLPADAADDSVPRSNTETQLQDDDAQSPALANSKNKSSLLDSMIGPDDFIAMRTGGWSPEVVPSRGSAKGTGQRQDTTPSDRTRIAPLDSGSGGGGDGMAIVGLSKCAVNDPPTYPEKARRQRQQGTVVLQLIVAADGHVRDVRVQQSSGYALLDAEAVRKFSTYVVTPYRENGVATDLELTGVPVVFRLK